MNEQQLSLDAGSELAPRKRPIETVHGLARYGDPETSHEAAQKITGRTERLLFSIFASGNGEWTADELCVWLPTVYPPTLVSALSRLHGHRLIEDSGERRPSRRGAAQIVWKLSSEAVEADPGFDRKRSKARR